VHLSLHLHIFRMTLLLRLELHTFLLDVLLLALELVVQIPKSLLVALSSQF
jgi:hypothetical protein